MNCYFTLALLFFLALLSDLFDGYLARRWNVVSNIGKLLDIVGDKLLAISSTLVFIFFINKYLLFLLIGEVIIISPSIYYLVTNKSSRKEEINRFNSSKYGKLKTWFLFITLGVTFISYKVDFFKDMLPFFIGITFIFQFITAYDYIKKYLIKKKG